MCAQSIPLSGNYQIHVALLAQTEDLYLFQSYCSISVLQDMGPSQDNSITSMSDKEIPWAIPKLTSDGSNWVMFKTCFLFTMAGRNVDRHLDESDTTPPAWTPSTPDETKWTTEDWDKQQAHLLLVRKWKHNKHVAWAQLAQVVSNSLLIRI